MRAGIASSVAIGETGAGVGVTSGVTAVFGDGVLTIAAAVRTVVAVVCVVVSVIVASGVSIEVAVSSGASVDLLVSGVIDAEEVGKLVFAVCEAPCLASVFVFFSDGVDEIGCKAGTFAGFDSFDASVSAVVVWLADELVDELVELLSCLPFALPVVLDDVDVDDDEPDVVVVEAELSDPVDG